MDGVILILLLISVPLVYKFIVNSLGTKKAKINLVRSEVYKNNEEVIEKISDIKEEIVKRNINTNESRAYLRYLDKLLADSNSYLDKYLILVERYKFNEVILKEVTLDMNDYFKVLVNYLQDSHLKIWKDDLNFEKMDDATITYKEINTRFDKLLKKS